MRDPALLAFISALVIHAAAIQDEPKRYGVILAVWGLLVSRAISIYIRYIPKGKMDPMIPEPHTSQTGA